MKQLLIIIAAVFLTDTLYSQMFESADSARNMAAIEEKPMLLYFSGSDWCPNCLRFEKTILHDSVFSDFVKNNIILLKADYPQRKKLSKSLVRQNDELARQYNPHGVFPTFVLFSSDHSTFSYVEFDRQLAVDFIALLDEKIKSFPAGE
ncbi:MAG: thioredoxin family protein [Bacteroidales bacterium]|nr:thioredoxin family protein [Bacteroidales bacterium]